MSEWEWEEWSDEEVVRAFAALDEPTGTATVPIWVDRIYPALEAVRAAQLPARDERVSLEGWQRLHRAARAWAASAPR